jgi:hypothetical protein
MAQVDLLLEGTDLRVQANAPTGSRTNLVE